jgi:hypothetical protein
MAGKTLILLLAKYCTIDFMLTIAHSGKQRKKYIRMQKGLTFKLLKN